MGFVEKLDRVNALVEIELFAEIDLRSHFDGVWPAYVRQSHGSKESGVAALDCIKSRFLKRVSIIQVLVGAHGKSLVGEFEFGMVFVRSLEDAEGGFDDFGTDAIAGQNSDFA